MATNFELAEAAINFSAGTEATWNGFVLPIPENVVIFTIDTKKFKRGDGNHRFSELPDGPSIEGISTGEETVTDVLVQLGVGDEDSIIVIDNEIYAASSTKLTDLIGRLNVVANANTVQNANMDAIVSQMSMVNSAVTSADNGKLAIVGSHKMKPGVLDNALVVAAPVSPINIRSFNFYSDINLTQECVEMLRDSTYYCNVHVQHDLADIDDITITLTETNSFVTVEHLDRGLFKIKITNPPVTELITFTATATYNTDTITLEKGITFRSFSPIIAAVYGGTGNDYFLGVTTDSQNNVICVGYTYSEGSGAESLIVKLDSNLDVIVRKRYGGTADDRLLSVITDSQDNIICGGYTASEGPANDNWLIIKFGSDLTIIDRKIYGGSLNDYLYAITVDSQDNIICVGSSDSEGSGNHDSVIVKFNSSLTVLYKKRYGGSGDDRFFAVATDSTDKIICVGYIGSEGAGNYDALIVKFNTDLTINARKIYGGSSIDLFSGVDVDSSDNIICVGYTNSEGAGAYDSLVIKFDPSLNIDIRKRFGGTGDDKIYGVAVDSENNITCAGSTTSGGAGSTDAFVAKFDSSLTLVDSKTYGGSVVDSFNMIAVDSGDNVICAGQTNSEGAGGSDGLLLKLPKDIPSGAITGVTLTGLVLNDLALVINDSGLSLAVSNVGLGDSNLTLSTSTATLNNSTTTFEKEVIEY